MKTNLWSRLILVGCLSALICGCDSPHEKTQKKMVAAYNDYADVLEGIKSNSDFVDAKPKLEKIGAQIKDIMNEMKALPAPTPDEQKKLATEFETDTQKAMQRVAAQIDRLGKIGVSMDDILGSMHMDMSMFGN